MNEDYGPLFQASGEDGSRQESVPTYGVHELNAAIEAALQQSFPQEIWIRGEIQGLARTRMRRHWYFELVEKEEGGDRIRSRISVALLQWNRGPVDRALRNAPGFELQDDLEVRIRCQVGYYAPWGKLQLIMVGVDPEFTLGQLAAQRERTLRALAADGLLERNGMLPAALVPQTIGLITSEGSAAYNDFVHELEASGFAFRIRLVDARVQGAEMEPTILAALARFRRQPPDVVVLIRGGGSRADLAGFDGEALARAIATMPVPVWTGIGHEIDSSVADAVAHRSFKTPTACAAALVETVEEFLDRLAERWEGISGAATQRVETQEGELCHAALRLAALARQSGRERAHVLGRAGERLAREARQGLRRRADRLDRSAQRGIAAARLHLTRADGRLSSSEARLSPSRLRPLLLRRGQTLDAAARRLPPAARRASAHLGESLERLGRQIHALDPRRLLQRGFSLSYGPAGELLRSVEGLVAGDSIRTILAEGEFESDLTETKKSVESEGDTT